jgi:hypothetical protein
MRRVKLKDPTGQFYDSETGLRVVKAAVVNLGSRVGKLTREWLNAGGLVIEDDVARPSVASPQEGVARDESVSPPQLDPSSPPPLSEEAIEVQKPAVPPRRPQRGKKR